MPRPRLGSSHRAADTARSKKNKRDEDLKQTHPPLRDDQEHLTMKTKIATALAVLGFVIAVNGAVSASANAAFGPKDLVTFDGPAYGPSDIRGFDGPAFGPADIRGTDGPAFGPADVRGFDGPANANQIGNNQR
jgi:hypothetical protein